MEGGRAARLPAPHSQSRTRTARVCGVIKPEGAVGGVGARQPGTLSVERPPITAHHDIISSKRPAKASGRAVTISRTTETRARGRGGGAGGGRGAEGAGERVGRGHRVGIRLRGRPWIAKTTPPRSCSAAGGVA